MPVIKMTIHKHSIAFNTFLFIVPLLQTVFTVKEQKTLLGKNGLVISITNSLKPLQKIFPPGRTGKGKSPETGDMTYFSTGYICVCATRGVLEEEPKYGKKPFPSSLLRVKAALKTLCLFENKNTYNRDNYICQQKKQKN